MKNSIYKIITGSLMAVLLMIGTTKISAQSVEIGARFMPTFASFNVSTPSTGRVVGNYSIGYGFGGFVGINFNEHIGIQGEFMYSAIAQKYKELDVERQINLKYINIPVLLSLNTSKHKAVNLNLVVGPQIGLSVGSSIGNNNSNGTAMSPVLSVKKGDLGFAYGAGVDFGLNSSRTVRLGIGYRGVMGLVDISDRSNSIETNSYYLLDKSKIKTNAAYIGLSILF